jgi:hypothetical protein
MEVAPRRGLVCSADGFRCVFTQLTPLPSLPGGPWFLFQGTGGQSLTQARCTLPCPVRVLDLLLRTPRLRVHRSMYEACGIPLPTEVSHPC